MSYTGIRGAAPRSLRTVAEDKGTDPAGFTGQLDYSATAGAVTNSSNKVATQPYKDPVGEPDMPARPDTQNVSFVVVR